MEVVEVVDVEVVKVAVVRGGGGGDDGSGIGDDWECRVLVKTCLGWSLIGCFEN
eukprot:m.117393 g.117393  ORF g.117393 m.117393 type:complete len:54 (-) comp12875_c0_seq1:80-241(-)